MGNLTIILNFLIIYGCRPSLPRNKHTVTTSVAHVATENAEEENPLIEKPTEKQMDSVTHFNDAIQENIEVIDLCDSEDEQSVVLSSSFDPETAAVTTIPSTCERPTKRNNSNNQENDNNEDSDEIS